MYEYSFNILISYEEMICKLILKNKENATTRGAVHGNRGWQEYL
jgi:hypothetical protein